MNQKYPFQHLATKATLKKREKSLKVTLKDFNYMDITGSYPGFKEKKSSELVMCSCCKKYLKRDIDIINYSSADSPNSEEVIKWKLALLLPREIYKSLSYKVLSRESIPYSQKFRYVIDFIAMENEIKFEDNICRLCAVEENKAPVINFEEFSNLKVAYKHQIMNELKIYEDFRMSSKNEEVEYKIQQYEIKLRTNEFINRSFKEYIRFSKITKVIPLLTHQYDNSESLNRRYYGKEDVRREQKQFEDLNAIFKEKLGYHKSVGKWKSEEELFDMVRKLYKRYNVIYQYKPSFLYDPITKGQQSIDIYIDKLKVGIEYQGKQHYEPIDIFGGYEGYKKTVERDKNKKIKCNNNGIDIIYIKYNEKITERFIRDKVEELFAELGESPKKKTETKSVRRKYESNTYGVSIIND